ncbi:MAG: ATP-binding protein, partial [Treponema sp.]|nr:ATP-binding protein [Treponema sp.]
MIEDENTEFKEIVVDDIKKEVAAFANTRGGNIYIGMKDDG